MSKRFPKIILTVIMAFAMVLTSMPANAFAAGTVTEITLNKSSLNLVSGKTKKLTAAVNDSATTKNLKWSSSNKAVVKVSGKNGTCKVTAVNEGEATITVKASNGVKATCKVTVESIEPTDVSLDVIEGFEQCLTIGDTMKLTTTILPSNATEKTLIWTSDNELVVTVDQKGNVTAVGSGVAVIIVETENGLSDVCVFSVTAPSVYLSQLDPISTKGDYGKESVPKDNLGNVYSDGVYFGLGLIAHSVNSSEFVIDGSYTTIKGIFALPYLYKNSSSTAILKIYGDDSLLYTSSEMGIGIEPIPFEVDITGVNRLKIEIDISVGKSGWHKFFLVDTELY